MGYREIASPRTMLERSGSPGQRRPPPQGERSGSAAGGALEQDEICSAHPPRHSILRPAQIVTRPSNSIGLGPPLRNSRGLGGRARHGPLLDPKMSSRALERSRAASEAATPLTQRPPGRVHGAPDRRGRLIGSRIEKALGMSHRTYSFSSEAFLRQMYSSARTIFAHVN